MPEIKIRDITMHYEILGKGTPLIFIHGLGSSAIDWKPQIQEFSNDYTVITVDLRGHGKTDKPKGPYSIQIFAEDVSLLLKSIGDAPAHIVGLSMGAAVAFHLALDHPDVVRTICISNMSAAMPVKTFRQKKNYYMRVLIVRLLGMKKMGSVIASNVFLKSSQKPLRDKLVERWAKNPKKPYLSALSALKNWSVMERISSITCPVLVIHSEHDYSPLIHKKKYTALIPNATLAEIPDSGHIVNIEKPDEYNRILKKFLSENEKSKQ
jgi:pimeloyl-ACP methyl ester carboxylesterase